MTADGRSQPPRTIIGWLSVLCVVLSGCDDRAALRDAVGQAEETGSYGIEWYAGSVESAFELARSQATPVLLYWGADWCPPCNRLKAAVFNRPEFIERTRLFVPVSLDGDDPGAQKLGERFEVVGYPTTIVFSPEGDEITRLSLGLDLKRYLEAMDAALAATRPVGAAYDAVLKGDATAAAELPPACVLLLGAGPRTARARREPAPGSEEPAWPRSRRACDGASADVHPLPDSPRERGGRGGSGRDAAGGGTTGGAETDARHPPRSRLGCGRAVRCRVRSPLAAADDRAA